MLLAKQFGVDPGTVQRISRPFDGGASALVRSAKRLRRAASRTQDSLRRQQEVWVPSRRTVGADVAFRSGQDPRGHPRIIGVPISRSRPSPRMCDGPDLPVSCTLSDDRLDACMLASRSEVRFRLVAATPLAWRVERREKTARPHRRRSRGSIGGPRLVEAERYGQVDARWLRGRPSRPMRRRAMRAAAKYSGGETFGRRSPVQRCEHFERHSVMHITRTARPREREGKAQGLERAAPNRAKNSSRCPSL